MSGLWWYGLKTMFITSASEKLSAEKLSDEPEAGKVIMVEIDVPGLPEHQARI